MSSAYCYDLVFFQDLCMHAPWAWSSPIQATYTSHNGGLVIFNRLQAGIVWLKLP